MNNQELDELLEKLHKELEGIEADDEEGRQLLRELSGDIRHLLEHAEAKKNVPPTLLDRIETSVDRFEVTYPELTTLLSNLSRILSNAGI